jgi:DNA-binding transcriptional ArsR family regulator
MAAVAVKTAGIEPSAELFRILGQETRLRLLVLLSNGEHSVGELDAISGIGQPALSQQLAILRKAGLVKTRREHKKAYYQIERDRLRETADLLALLAGSSPTAEPRPIRSESKVPLRNVGPAASFARLL